MTTIEWIVWIALLLGIGAVAALAWYYRALWHIDRERKWDYISEALTTEKAYWGLRNLYLQACDGSYNLSVQMAEQGDEIYALQERLSEILCPMHNHVWDEKGFCKKCGRYKYAE